jgi:DNA-binding SARP family transcriptional activator
VQKSFVGLVTASAVEKCKALKDLKATEVKLLKFDPKREPKVCELAQSYLKAGNLF